MKNVGFSWMTGAFRTMDDTLQQKRNTPVEVVEVSCCTHGFYMFLSIKSNTSDVLQASNDPGLFVLL